MSSSDPKNPEEAKPSFDDQASKEATESLTSTKTLEETDHTNTPVGENQEEEEDGDEGECGFCLFMKGGGCKDAFIAWEDCIKQAEEKKEDIVENCFEVTSALKLCMEAHADYYEPILRAEKAAEQEAIKQLEKEKEEEAAAAAEKSQSNEKEK
ncbi:unnamed protein product [Dovyalis caffra]|uniref:GCK domain-containing protein n=1 Tax=Dovyalis caffra TaxID=77055 RepID=A0AAV1S1W8_9ROSI|nr:unnamed protein product [Dovyalis caffra]